MSEKALILKQLITDLARELKPLIPPIAKAWFGIDVETMLITHQEIIEKWLKRNKHLINQL